VPLPRFVLGPDVADFAHDTRDVGNPAIRCNVAGERDLLV